MPIFQRLLLILFYVTRLLYMYIYPIPLLSIPYMIAYLLYSLLYYSFPQIVNSLSNVFLLYIILFIV